MSNRYGTQIFEMNELTMLFIFIIFYYKYEIDIREELLFVIFFDKSIIAPNIFTNIISIFS